MVKGIVVDGHCLSKQDLRVLKLQLEGGAREAMFQPSGFSRPDSWCRGTPFYPPRNTDDSIQHLDYKSHYERKE